MKTIKRSALTKMYGVVYESSTVKHCAKTTPQNNLKTINWICAALLDTYLIKLKINTVQLSYWNEWG